jgi:alpha,alpha-trehalose-phosphate synthase [UDP-forming]
MIKSAVKQSDLVIVSNRLPVQRVRRNRMLRWEMSTGGLVSALRSILREVSCTWVGWAGESEDHPAFEFEGIENRPVPLSKSEVQSFYEGFSNRILWPLYHDAIRPPEYRQSWWQPFVDVNRRFAQAAAEAVSSDGIIWVHDYHLQLVPQMIRELRPDARIGFFLHIPFPPQELFAQLPWRREILEGLLGSDVIGFQTEIGAQNFRQVACRFGNATCVDDSIEFNGRAIHVGSYPISVDVEHFAELALKPKIVAKSKELQTRLGQSRKIMLGIDRLDYTKGIDIRLQAFRELLRTRRVTPDECVLVQIAVPSREHVAEYKELRVNVERLVGEIEGEFGEIGRNPVQYLHRAISQDELVALYLAADVMLVTPLRDGMNLVAKEYVASRTDDTGVLVLSEFTGAARELKSALLVNPHDIPGLVSRMERGLRMPQSEQTVRMKSMRNVVKRHHVHAWADSFMQSLAYART